MNMPEAANLAGNLKVEQEKVTGYLESIGQACETAAGWLAENLGPDSEKLNNVTEAQAAAEDLQQRSAYLADEIEKLAGLLAAAAA